MYTAKAGTYPLADKTNRYAYDMYSIPRPALSLRGFDNQNIGAYQNAFSPKIFGVRQLIEKIYDSSADQYWVDLMAQHINNADKNYFDDPEKDASLLRKNKK